MKFYLPDFDTLLHLNLSLLQLHHFHPEYFYEGIEFGGIYGTFPGAIWNGGRLLCGSTSSTRMKETIALLNDADIPLRYTYTNPLLEEKHLYDTYCNLTMELANNGMNEVIINSPVLEEYLRKNYPNFKYILSTTRCERDLGKINEATEQYDLVVIDYRDNYNFDFLEGIKNKDKIELLINAYCHPNCKLRQKHYETIAKHQLNFEMMNPETDGELAGGCPTYRRGFYDILGFPSVIKVDDLYGKYTDMGFSHFKIEGRTMPIAQVMESYIYYLVKPEYQNQVRLTLLSQCIKG